MADKENKDVELYAFAINLAGGFRHKFGYYLKYGRDKTNYLFVFSKENGKISSNIEVNQGKEEEIKQKVEEIENQGRRRPQYYEPVAKQLTEKQANVFRSIHSFSDDMH